MNDKTTDRIKEIVSLKHLSGQHNQKRHGWRYSGGLDSARRAMRGQGEAERTEYRKRANMPAPAKIPKADPKGINDILTTNDLKGFKKGTYYIVESGKKTPISGITKGDYGITDTIITHLPTGLSVPVRAHSMDAAKLAVSSLIRNKVLDEIKDAKFGEGVKLSKETLTKLSNFQNDVMTKVDSTARSFSDARKAARQKIAEDLESGAIYKPANRPYHKGIITFDKGSQKSIAADSRGFKNARFETRQIDGSFSPVTGKVKGDWGIHAEMGSGFVLTHIPSGVRAFGVSELSTAKKSAGLFDRVLPHLEVFLSKINSRSNDDIQTITNLLDSFGGLAGFLEYLGD